MKKTIIAVLILSFSLCFSQIGFTDQISSYDEELSESLNENSQRYKDVRPDMGEEISEDAGSDVGEEIGGHISEESMLGRE